MSTDPSLNTTWWVMLSTLCHTTIWPAGRVAGFGENDSAPLMPTTLTVTGHETDVTFGPRLSFPIGKFRPFGEALFGVGHVSTGQGISTSDTSLVTTVGGGLDYKIIRILALRAEGDYVQTRFFSTTQNNFRLSTGIVFRF